MAELTSSQHGRRPANPFKNTHAIHPDGSVTPGSISSMSGYTLLEADTLETVLEWVRSCPFLDIDGTLEVSELIKMDQS